MMTPRHVARAAGLLAIVAVAACTDRPDKGMPTAPKLVRDAAGNVVMGACTNLATLNTLAAQVFGAGSPNVNSVLGKLDNLSKKVDAGNIAGAQAQANNIVSFVRDKAADGRLAGSSAVIDSFINSVLCFAGLSPNTYLIQPTDQPQIKIASDSLSGISLPGQPVGTPTLLTITTLSPTGPSPLITKLDQYPTYTDMQLSSPLVGTAIVAVCPSADVPASIRPRLRLGHQATAGFEITPPADGSFLPCNPPASLSQSRVPGWLRTVASLIVPKPLYAQFEAAERGGVGGTASEFSPFGAVDPELELERGGVGGTASEFKKTGTTRPGIGPVATAPAAGTTSPATSKTPTTGVTLAPTMALAIDDPCGTTVSTAVSESCRPAMVIRTHNGTPMIGVQVDWAVTGGGGSIAPAANCGTINQTSFSTTSDATGLTGICWQVGPNGGPNTVTAIPRAGTAGSDAPAGVRFFSDPTKTGLVFSIEGLKITPTAGATGGSFTFDGSPHAGSGSCSNALTPALTYSGIGAVPTDVGEYTLTVTCGEGSTVYNTVTATAPITISVVTPAVAVSCPVSVVYDGSAQTPCSATVTAPGGLSLTPTPSYSANINVGTATASVSVAANGNYGAASGSATFEITPAPTTTAVTCDPASMTYTGSSFTPCSATTTGAGGLSEATAVVHTNNTNVGTGTGTATFAAAGNYQASAGSATFAITPAVSTTTVSCPASVTYTGSPLTLCTASATGAGNLNVAITPNYSSNVNVGTASVAAAYAGDANHTASNGSASFAITPAGTSVATTCSSVNYNGSVQNPCTATASGPDFSGLSVGVTYNPLAPRNAGSYSGIGVFAGGGNYVGSSSAAVSFAIAKLAATATAGSATINFGAAVPAIPCTVSGLLGVDAGSVTCATSASYSVAGSFATTPVVSPPSPANYDVTGVNGTLTVLGYKQVGCFSSPVYSVMPDSKSAQRKGSNLPIKCTLTTAQGAGVTNATGSIVVVDRGTAGTSAPVTVFTSNGANVFSVSGSGNYAYGLNTGLAGYIAGHYYFVTATWKDGSTTTGWFILK